MNNPPSLHTYTHFNYALTISVILNRERKSWEMECWSLCEWVEGVCEEEWRGKEEGNSFSREGLRTAEKLRRREEWGWWGAVMGGVVPHRTCVSVCWNVFYPPALLILTQKLRRGDAWPQHKLTGQRKRGKQECSFKANQLIIERKQDIYKRGVQKRITVIKLNSSSFSFSFFLKSNCKSFWNAWDNNSNR